MKCPVCKNYALVARELEQNLSSQQCPHCNGRWIGSFQYWKWHETSGKSITESNPPASTEHLVADSTKAKLCPECGHFLRRYSVGHDIEFGLDRCGNCGGMWFDQNEWEVLKCRNLHDDVHNIFSEIWQRQLRDKEHQAAMEAFYKEKFGVDDYQKAMDIKTWLDAHPSKAALRAFLGL
jgi:Zn-finger nucleic acid-binding protein